MLPSPIALSTQRLAEFLAIVSSAPDTFSAIQMTTERAAKALEAEVAAFLRHDGSVMDLVGFPIGSMPTAELAAVVAGERSVLDVPGAGPCHTAVGPLGGRTPGHLLVARSGDDGFSADELSLVRGMARVLELTVETLHMFEVERRQVAEKEQLLASLQERHRLLEQISQVQRAITRRAPLPEILDAITAGAQALLEDEVAGLRMFDPDDPQMMLLVSSTGIASELTRQLWRIPATEAGVTGQAAMRNELVVMPRYPEAPHRIPELAAARIQAAMAAPVHDKSTVVGALAVASYRPDRVYTTRDQQLLQVFAEQISLAVTDARTQEAMRQAFHDSLTGLASRALFMDRLDHALASAARDRSSLAVLFIDLDRFKLINDSLGHTAGDAVLVCVAARLGGDEFAVVLHGLNRDQAVAIAERIIAVLQAPFLIDDREVFVNASIGVVLNVDRSADGRTMLRNADLAMYHAKKNGKGRHETFEPTMGAMPVGSLDLESALHRALAANEFVLHYQPIVELPGGLPEGLFRGCPPARVVAVEALVRWQYPVHGLTSPRKFVPLAEETGLILPIGRWVIREACRQASVWNARRIGQPPLMVSVNLSARQLQRADLCDVVAASLAETGLAPDCLMLEITESQLLRDTEVTVDGLRRLKDLGVRLAIDDFGTGYSSLTHLRRFPIDTLKIDKSFVDEIASPKGSALVRATVQFGQAMELTTFASCTSPAATSARGTSSPSRSSPTRSRPCSVSAKATAGSSSPRLAGRGAFAGLGLSTRGQLRSRMPGDHEDQHPQRTEEHRGDELAGPAGSEVQAGAGDQQHPTDGHEPHQHPDRPRCPPREQPREHAEARGHERDPVGDDGAHGTVRPGPVGGQRQYEQRDEGARGAHHAQQVGTPGARPRVPRDADHGDREDAERPAQHRQHSGGGARHRGSTPCREPVRDQRIDQREAAVADQQVDQPGQRHSDGEQRHDAEHEVDRDRAARSQPDRQVAERPEVPAVQPAQRPGAGQARAEGGHGIPVPAEVPAGPDQRDDDQGEQQHRLGGAAEDGGHARVRAPGEVAQDDRPSHPAESSYAR